jgi:threonine/homoserine/homoserine lactone efflux protein
VESIRGSFFCIRRTLTDGRWSGFVSGMGAATADALYGAMAGFGLTFVSTFLVGQQLWLRLAGGVVLCLLGARSFMSRPPAHGEATSSSALGAWASTFALTLTNPMTILSFAAVFAGLGVPGAGGRYDLAGALVLGVFAGSALWWLVLSAGVGLARARLGPRGLAWVNRLSGAVIFAFGVAALAGSRP